jgi:hypothetical protein
VRGRVHVHEHRHRAKLQDGVDGGGEARGHADHFVTRLDGALAQLGRSEGAEGHQVGRRARVDGDQVLDADEGGELFLEFGVEAAGGEPAVQEASTMFLSSWAPMTLPEGGTTEAPGRNGCGARAMAAYSSTSCAIWTRRAWVLLFSMVLSFLFLFLIRPSVPPGRP